MSYNQSRECWTTQAYLSEIFSAPHFSMLIHTIIMIIVARTADATVERNIETSRDVKGEILF